MPSTEWLLSREDSHAMLARARVLAQEVTVAAGEPDETRATRARSATEGDCAGPGSSACRRSRSQQGLSSSNRSFPIYSREWPSAPRLVSVGSAKLDRLSYCLEPSDLILADMCPDISSSVPAERVILLLNGHDEKRMAGSHSRATWREPGTRSRGSFAAPDLSIASSWLDGSRPRRDFAPVSCAPAAP